LAASASLKSELSSESNTERGSRVCVYIATHRTWKVGVYLLYCNESKRIYLYEATS
jgi:hypothetical protein